MGLEPNPRRIKRTLNMFLLLWRLSQNRDELKTLIKPVRLAKIVIIQQYYPRLFQLITEGPHYLIDLERRFREQDKQGAGGEEWQGWGTGTGTGTGAASAGPLTEFLGHGLLRKLLLCGAGEPDANFEDIGPFGVREYVYLTRSTAQPAPPAPTEVLPFETQMEVVPAGVFLMGTPESELDTIAKLGVDRMWIQTETPQHEINLPAYAIGRYPVTNAEFARCIQDNGYATREYWTEAGWKQKSTEGWKQPRFWEDSRLNDPAQPVVGVSWYEAVAYCNWLASRTGKPYRLPTEAEWEKAARGTDRRRYPWGNQWDARNCNNKENKQKGDAQTTPVGQYSPQGDSPHGVGDLVGQVWEWCSSKWGGTDPTPKRVYPCQDKDGREELDGDDTRVLRGGSWGSDHPAAICRCGYRGWNVPGNRSDVGGFRSAMTLSS